MPLKVLHTEYASVVQPIVAFIDEVRAQHPDDQLVVLIPVVRPTSGATGSCTTRSTWSSPRRCAAGTTSWWPGSRCRWNRGPGAQAMEADSTPDPPSGSSSS